MGTYLGQNFLADTKVQNYIANKISKIYEKNNLEAIIEIGPGRGAITKKIHQISKNFCVIEKDSSMKEHLEKFLFKEQIIFADILNESVEKKLKEKKINPKKTLIVGNLPYYITSPIFRKFFGNGKQEFFGGFFMIQDEVGEKIKTDSKKKSFLWWLVNYAYDVIYQKTVGAKSFNPVPKVKSCLVEFKIKNEKTDLDFNKLLEFLDLYAPFSRKTLGAIEKILEKQNKKIFQTPEKLKKHRLENLSWENIKNITNIKS
ncbi:MAG: hypothetical protein M0P94_02125 [Candidatus Absconditabacterales bacterium]|nr:hypothetical protein [Candidatus Absconditabacterales bacterium]